MEWEKILPITLSFAAFLFGAFTFYLQRKDKQREKQAESAVELEIAHLTEGTTLRKDLREMLNDANGRIDKLETMLIAANNRINELTRTVNDLTFEKTILEREKKMLQEDIERRENLFETENCKLRERVTELEKQVDELKNHQSEISG